MTDKKARSGGTMGASAGPGDGLPDAAELSRQMAGIAEKSQRLVADFLQRQGKENGVGLGTVIDPLIMVTIGTLIIVSGLQRRMPVGGSPVGAVPLGR